MKAVSCLQGALTVVDLPDPRPTQGQLVLDVTRCGICGSDLHSRHYADEVDKVMVEGGYHDYMRSDTPVVMGHEYCGKVTERGKRVAKEFKVGTSVVSFPMVRAYGAVQMVGLSPKAPGGYAEQVLAEAAMTFVVPNGLAPTSPRSPSQWRWLCTRCGAARSPRATWRSWWDAVPSGSR